MAGISKKTYKTKKGDKTIFVVTYRDIEGKQHTAGTYKTLKEAKAHINDFEDASADSNNITFGKLFQIFLDRAERKYALNTIETYNTYYNIYFKRLEHIQYKKANSIMLQKLFDEIELHSPYVAQTCLKFAKAAINYSINHGKKVKYNIFNDIEKIKLPKANIEHLTISELLHVLDVCQNDPYFSKFYVMLFTFVGSGMREGELIALNIEDFNYKELSLTVNKQFTRGLLKPKPKTESSNRIIYIFQVLGNVINEHIKKLPQNCKILFPNEAGNYYNASNLRERFWKPLLNKCGINKRVRLHDLRGSYVDLLYSNRLSCKFGQNQLGHAKAETTNNVYAQNNQDMIFDAQNILNNVFLKKCEKNVRIINENADKKIIQFPKTTLETGF